MVLGRYRIVRRLARGGMGVVYLARSEGAAGFAQPVVIKRIIPDLTGDDQMARMFVREARILSNLRHPNIVQVIEFAEDDDAYVMILEYVHGYHLGRWAKFARKEEGQFSALFAMHVVAKVLDALHHAHTLVKPDGSAYSIVHRDVSQSNVHISVEGQVKLIDFGIARVSRESGEYQTEEISLKGKLPYMAPELFKSGTPSPSTDIYACGVMLHELLTGRHEFRGKEMSETVNLVLHHRVSPVSSTRSDVSARIDEVVWRALAKKPEQRFATAEEFASALRAIRGMAEAEADALMKERIKRDFQGPLAQSLGVVTLEELDQAWRSPPASMAPSLNPGRGDATEVDVVRVPSRPPVQAPVPLWVILSVFAIAGATLLAGGILWMRRRPPPPVAPTFQNVNAQESPAEVPKDEPAPAPGPSTSGESRTALCTAAVTAVLPAYAKCFTSYGEEVKEITLTFDIAADGHVNGTKVLPESLGVTQFTECVAKVANAIRFPVNDAMTFTIPIKSR